MPNLILVDGELLLQNITDSLWYWIRAKVSYDAFDTRLVTWDIDQDPSTPPFDGDAFVVVKDFLTSNYYKLQLETFDVEGGTVVALTSGQTPFSADDAVEFVLLLDAADGYYYPLAAQSDEFDNIAPTMGIEPYLTAVGESTITLGAYGSISGTAALQGSSSLKLTAQATSVGTTSLSGQASIRLNATGEGEVSVLAPISGQASLSLNGRASAVFQAVGELSGSARVSLNASGQASVNTLVPISGQATVTLNAQAASSATAHCTGSANLSVQAQTGSVALAVTGGSSGISLVSRAVVTATANMIGSTKVSLVAHTGVVATIQIAGEATVSLGAHLDTGIRFIGGSASVNVYARGALVGTAHAVGSTIATLTGSALIAGAGGAAGRASLRIDARGTLTGTANAVGGTSMTVRGRSAIGGTGRLEGGTDLRLDGRGFLSQLNYISGNAGLNLGGESYLIDAGYVYIDLYASTHFALNAYGRLSWSARRGLTDDQIRSTIPHMLWDVDFKDGTDSFVVGIDDVDGCDSLISMLSTRPKHRLQVEVYSIKNGRWQGNGWRNAYIGDLYAARDIFAAILPPSYRTLALQT